MILRKEMDFKTPKGQGIVIKSQLHLPPDVPWDTAVFETPIKLGGGVYRVGFIGAFTYTSGNVSMLNVKSIGRFCSIEENVTLGCYNHPVDMLSHHNVFYGWGYDWHNEFHSFEQESTYCKENLKYAYAEMKKLNSPIIIGNDVWIGSHSIILGGVTIGDGAVITAGSVVTQDVEPYTIVSGNPARIIRKRFSDEVIQELLNLRWWDYGPDILKELNLNEPQKYLSELRKRVNSYKKYKCETFKFDLLKENYKINIPASGEENEKIVLYHAANLNCLMKCMLHRLIYHTKDKAIFIGQTWAKKYNLSAVFDHVYTYPAFIGYAGSKNDINANEYKEFILDYFDDVFVKMGITLTDISDFHIGSYYADFTFYLVYKKIKHYVHEETWGDLIPKEPWEADVQYYPTACAIRKECGSYNFDNDYILGRYGVLSELPKQYHRDYDMNFNPCEEIEKLNEEQRQLIRGIYGVPELKIENKSALLLTQWFTENGVKKSDDSLILMYQLILDFLCADFDKIYIKPHPADPKKDDYKNNMCNVNLITAEYPFELTGLALNGKFDYAITISSSAIKATEKISRRSFELQLDFTNSFRILYRYLGAVNIFKVLSKKYTCYRYGIFDELSNTLTGSNNDFPSIKWKNFDNILDYDYLIIDKFKWYNNDQPEFDVNILEKAKNTSLLVFLNKNDSLFDEMRKRDLLKYIIEYRIQKTKLKETVFDSLEDEHFYVFCKEKKIRDLLIDFKMEREFKHTGIKIMIECDSNKR